MKNGKLSRKKTQAVKNLKDSESLEFGAIFKENQKIKTRFA